MKKYTLSLCLFAAIIAGCGNNSDSEKNDSLKKDSVAAVIDPEKPHEVKKGKGGVYAFMPDTAIQSIILGNPECLKKFFKENGLVMPVSLGNDRQAVAYYNSSKEKKQKMELRFTKNGNGEDVVYSIIVQRMGDEHAPELSTRAIPSSDFNYVSSHGIYIGMPLDHVMSIYSNQSFMEWEKGDTVYLEYRPKPKDGNYFKRYKPDSYSVMYKFKDETLRRMEYSVDPKEFEKQ